MRKLVYIIIFTILLVVVFTGCGNKSQATENVNVAPEPAKQTEEIKTEETPSTGGIEVSMGQAGSSMALPDSFPKDVVPLLDDANIVNVNDNKAAKALGIAYMTGKKLEEAHEFYANALKGAEGYEETKVDGGYMIYGTKEKYHITAIIVTYQDDNVSVGLEIGMQDVK